MPDALPAGTPHDQLTDRKPGREWRKMKSNILIVGGAGYIGSHMCKYLAKNGFTPVVFDNLIYGHRDAVQWGPLIEGTVADTPLLEKVLKEHRIEGVMHFAAFAYVGESVTDPAKYYRNNVTAPIALLDAMRRCGVERFIFSSSCATYGDPVHLPMTEEHPRQPINPYGRTKLMVEQILEDYGNAYGIRSVSLRYFNAAGADPEGELGEDHRPETHLIPLVLQTALGQRESISIFGDDYDTDDGTCVRDYIHVEDLAQAHLLALERLFKGEDGGVYNLGNGDGYSVKEVIETARRVTGKPVPVQIAPRRAGDPPILVGSSRKAREELGWQPRFAGLDTMIRTAWDWHRRHPDGYAD